MYYSVWSGNFGQYLAERSNKKVNVINYSLWENLLDTSILESPVRKIGASYLLVDILWLIERDEKFYM